MRRKLAGLLAVAILSSTVMSQSFAEQNVQAAEIIASGKCGKSCTWILDDAGTLTIRGSGAMQNMRMKFLQLLLKKGSQRLA